MAGVLDPGVHEKRNRAVDVGICEYELWRLAPELERDRYDVFGGSSLNELSHGNRPGERNVVHVCMTRERSAGLVAQARYDVEGARRKSGLSCQVRERQGGETCFFGWFEHCGIACGECRTNRAADDLHGIVPRHDVACDAMRLPQCVDGVPVEVRNGRPVQLVCSASVELHVSSERKHICPCLGQRFANVERLELAEYFGVLEDELSEASEHPTTFDGCRRSPDAIHRRSGGTNGEVDVLA